MKKLFNILVASAMVMGFTACDTDEEHINVQPLKEYDPQYYQNLRDYRKTDHAVFFGYYAAYAPLEGVEGWKEPASYGERFVGLPDSCDIINLWMGIPSGDPNDEDYQYMPVAYQDMRYCQSMKGMKFVSHSDASNRSQFTLDGVVYDRNEEPWASDIYGWLDKYAEKIVADVMKYDLDGTDIDFEPNGWWSSNDYFPYLCSKIGAKIGPMGKRPDKLFIIDFFSHFPPAECGQYADYYVLQAYTHQVSSYRTASGLQSAFNRVADAIPSTKFIICDNLSDGGNYENAGQPFTEADGNTVTSDFWCGPVGKGTRMYSLEGFSRWNPTQGRKGGFGGFYFDRDYYNKTGIPYYNVRRAIQQCNPSVQK